MSEGLSEQHAAAIKLRLEYEYALSEKVFRGLIKDLKAKPDLKGMLGRVYRDYGMLMVDKGQLADASRYIQASLRILRDIEDAGSLGDASLVVEAEYANSLGFLARVCALQGHVDEARWRFADVDRVLSRYSPHYDDARINNAVWRLKWLTPITRWRLLPSLLHLGLRAPRVSNRRVVELAIIGLFGKRGYDRLRSFVR